MMLCHMTFTSKGMLEWTFVSRNLDSTFVVSYSLERFSESSHQTTSAWVGKQEEANVAVQLFSNAITCGVLYSTYVGDEDSTTESRLKSFSYCINQSAGLKPTSLQEGLSTIVPHAFGQHETYEE